MPLRGLASYIGKREKLDACIAVDQEKDTSRIRITRFVFFSFKEAIQVGSVFVCAKTNHRHTRRRVLAYLSSRSGFIVDANDVF